MIFCCSQRLTACKVLASRFSSPLTDFYQLSRFESKFYTCSLKLFYYSYYYSWMVYLLHVSPNKKYHAHQKTLTAYLIPHPFTIESLGDKDTGESLTATRVLTPQRVCSSQKQKMEIIKFNLIYNLNNLIFNLNNGNFEKK